MALSQTGALPALPAIRTRYSMSWHAQLPIPPPHSSNPVHPQQALSMPPPAAAAGAESTVPFAAWNQPQTTWPASRPHTGRGPRAALRRRQQSWLLRHRPCGRGNGKEAGGVSTLQPLPLPEQMRMQAVIPGPSKLLLCPATAGAPQPTTAALPPCLQHTAGGDRRAVAALPHSRAAQSPAVAAPPLGGSGPPGGQPEPANACRLQRGAGCRQQSRVNRAASCCRPCANAPGMDCHHHDQ